MFRTILTALAIVAAAATTPLTPSVEAGSGPRAGIERAPADYVQVTSPWGYTDWYWVEPGPNTLRCRGTGQTFEYYY